MRKVSSGGGKASQVEGGLRFDAEAWVVSEAPTHFEASSTVTNVSDKLVTLEYGACAFSVRAYPESGWTGWQKPEAWDPRRQPEPLLMIPAPYILILRITTLDPGGSLSFRALITPTRLLGIAPSAYYGRRDATCSTRIST